MVKIWFIWSLEVTGLTFNSYTERKTLMMDYKGSLNLNTSRVNGLENMLRKHLEEKKRLEEKTITSREKQSRRKYLEEEKLKVKKKSHKEKNPL